MVGHAAHLMIAEEHMDVGKTILANIVENSSVNHSTQQKIRIVIGMQS